MAETYTRKVITVSAAHNAHPSTGSTKTLTIPDSKVEIGAQKLAMQTGASFLTQGQDGMLSLHVFDAELSTPNNPVLRRV